MKIGILTFHYAHNYGAVLQCYALQVYLESLGHNVKVIDYRSKYIASGYRLFDVRRFLGSKNPISILKKLLNEIKLFPQRLLKYLAFNNFINKEIKLSYVKNISDGEYDYIILGSDQIWNLHITGGFDKMYWGTFHLPSSTKIISYAASVENLWPSEHVEEAINNISKLESVSVREVQIADYIKSFLPGKKIQQVVDPTLLLSTKQWSDIVGERIIKQQYLLLYMIRIDQRVYIKAKYRAKQKGLKFICLTSKICSYNSLSVISVGPSKMLSLFKYASEVVSTSFHGTVFSIIFSRPFYMIKDSKGANTRVESLLSQLNLLDHLVELDCLPDNDWKGLSGDNMTCIERISENSKQFLFNSLK